jgi:putative transposase
MPEYRRWRLEGATYFFTIVTHERRSIFADSRNVELLRQAIALVHQERPFEIEAAVILPDHLHFLWTLPPNDADFSGRISRVKALFTRSFQPRPDRSPSLSRKRKRESTVWQRRFWERMIRPDEDIRPYLDYIHYNPVKHGHAACPHEWTASSFSKWVAAGVYDQAWGCSCKPGKESAMRIPDLEGKVGEQ